MVNSLSFLVSLTLHLGLCLSVLYLTTFQNNPREKKEKISFRVVVAPPPPSPPPAPVEEKIEKPPEAINQDQEIGLVKEPVIDTTVTKKKKRPSPQKKKVERVFGISKNTLTSKKGSGGAVVKYGNTVAKKQDQKKISKKKATALPVPRPEYLLSKMPEVIREAPVRYPQKAKAMGIEGTVVLSILIDAEGRVRDAKVIEGLISSLDDEALRAIKNYQFSPGKMEQKNVPVRIRYAVNFVLQDH